MFKTLISKLYFKYCISKKEVGKSLFTREDYIDLLLSDYKNDFVKELQNLSNIKDAENRAIKLGIFGESYHNYLIKKFVNIDWQITQYFNLMIKKK